jgi:hypothetical protein
VVNRREGAIDNRPQTLDEAADKCTVLSKYMVTARRNSHCGQVAQLEWRRKRWKSDGI